MSFHKFQRPDPVFEKNGRQLSEEKTLYPSMAVFVQNTLLQTALKGSATRYGKRVLYPQHSFVPMHMTSRKIFWNQKNSFPHLL